MNPAEVLANFPEEEAYEQWMGGSLNDALLFPGIVFLFDECESEGPLPDSKMTDFLLRRPEAWFAGNPLNWWTLQNTTKRLHERSIGFTTKFVPLESRLRDHIDWASYIDIESLSVSLKFTEQGECLELSASIY
jgi:hypothetical protein